AYDETANGSASGFATNWLFIPQYDSGPTLSNCSTTAYGCWTSNALVVNNGFASAGSFNTRATHYDWAFAVVGAGGKNNTQLDALGSFGLTASSISSGTVDAFGYPAAGKYHGNDLTYCQGPVGFDALTGNTNYRLACNMTGGSPGGPWLSGFAAADGSTTGNGGTIRSLNSYGYGGQAYMYGPIFNGETTRTLNAANTATSNTIVSCTSPCRGSPSSRSDPAAHVVSRRRTRSDGDRSDAARLGRCPRSPRRPRSSDRRSSMRCCSVPSPRTRRTSRSTSARPGSTSGQSGSSSPSTRRSASSPPRPGAPSPMPWVTSGRRSSSPRSSPPGRRASSRSPA